MKKINIVLIICVLISCKSRGREENVELTDFTKELISLYINDSENVDAKNRKDEIIVTVVADTSYYYLSVFANNRKEYKFCREDFIGQTHFFNHSVRLFGNTESPFYTIKTDKNISSKKCKQQYICYDPSIWQVCLLKDTSFYKMRTYKVSPSEDISEIQNLAKRFFKISGTITDEIFQSIEVENEPKFALGEDSLRHIISSNFKIRKDVNFGKIPLIISIIVDKKGKATLKEIVKSSNDTELDNEAIRVAKIICQYNFIPASHRGETVKVIYHILFFQNDIRLTPTTQAHSTATTTGAEP